MTMLRPKPPLDSDDLLYHFNNAVLGARESATRALAVLVLPKPQYVDNLWQVLMSCVESDRVIKSLCPSALGLVDGLQFYSDSMVVYIDQKHTLFLFAESDQFKSTKHHINFDIIHLVGD